MRSDAEQASRWETDGGHLLESPGDAQRAQEHHVGRQLAAVGQRLCREFAPDGGAGATAIRDMVREARTGFGNPDVIAYLPALVERMVRRRLRDHS
ncbi:three-helix bundle dimerization domain-containing protein [Pseudonocardia sp. GCM10023141]|uniref:three-helix bundle dimerization domain-containing protein n=1 Tax=Pseudonocardia sp. GCM10023141 TaxID=3252653 RepID=UPI0036213CF7